MPLLRGQLAGQKNAALNSFIIAFFGLLMAEFLAFIFSIPNLFTFPTLILDFIAIFFGNYFFFTFLDRGLDRVLLSAVINAFFVGFTSALTSTATPSFVWSNIFTSAVGAIFAGILFVGLVLEYLSK